MVNREAERKRLVELLKLPSNCMPHAKCENCGLNGGCSVQRQADKLLDNGVVVPPVKVGQSVYVIHNTVERIELGLSDCIYETVVDAIHISGEIEYHLYYKKIVHPDCDFFTEKDIGKTVFTSREDAERALKGGADK